MILEITFTILKFALPKNKAKDIGLLCAGIFVLLVAILATIVLVNRCNAKENDLKSFINIVTTKKPEIEKDNNNLKERMATLQAKIDRLNGTNLIDSSINDMSEVAHPPLIPTPSSNNQLTAATEEVQAQDNGLNKD